MKLTKEELYNLIEEAISLGGRRKKKAAHPTGSKGKPCPEDWIGKGLGAELFHPQVPGTTEWECNTKIEDDVLRTLQNFISRNKWEGDENVEKAISRALRIGGSANRPLRKLPPGKKLYRGESLNWQKRPNKCWKIINSLNFKKPVDKFELKGGAYYAFPVDDYVLEPFRVTTSFTVELTPALAFATRQGGIVYQTNSSQAPSNGVFFEFTQQFYDLVDNPDYEIKSRLGPPPSPVKGFENEKETLYFGKAPLPIESIYINWDLLLEDTKILEKHYGEKIIKWRQQLKEIAKKYGWVDQGENKS